MIFIKGVNYLKIMNNANGKELLEEHFKVNTIEHRHLCKKCGSVMTLKKGGYGEFYGCSNYPKCRYTEGRILNE